MMAVKLASNYIEKERKIVYFFNMVDFLFVYEVKNRELENICLLKYELERRGYSVKIVETWRRYHYYVRRIKAKVVIGFAAYTSGIVTGTLSFSKKCKKFVDFQWEQVFTVYEEESKNSSHSFTGLGTKITHICWGQYSHERLNKLYNIDKKLLPITGHLSFDFLKPKLIDYYQDKDQIIDKYSLLNQPIYLFIAGFNLVDTPLNLFEKEDLGFNPVEMKKFCEESQSIILKWFEKALSMHPEITLIYRPHPAEVGNNKLFELAKQYPNFKVIRDLSVKQWILISDKIFTWNSTSVVEVLGANRSCTIIRPLPIPPKNDSRLFIDANIITDETDFINDYLIIKKDFPIDENIIRKYYSFDSSYTYLKICDELVNIYNDDAFNIEYKIEPIPIKDKLYISYTKKRDRIIAKLLLKKNKIVSYLISRKKTWSITAEQIVFKEKNIINNYANPLEIRRITKKIKKCLEGR